MESSEPAVSAFALAQAWDAFADHIVSGHPDGDCEDPFWCDTARPLYVAALQINHRALEQGREYARGATRQEADRTARHHGGGKE